MAIRVSPFVYVATMSVLFAVASNAHAQSAQNTLVLGVSAVQYDLVGVGTGPGMIVRGTRALTDHLAVEGSFPMSWLSESFGRVTLFTPEAQLQYHWKAGPFRPYVGGGGGISWVDRGMFGNSGPDLTLSAGGGTRYDLTDRVALLGELRLRGIKQDFAASTAEWLGGLSWSF